MKKAIHWLAIAILVVVVFVGQQLGLLSSDSTDSRQSAAQTASQAAPEKSIDEGGQYSTKDEVALYLHTHKKLPSNFLTKKEAEKLGFDNHQTTLDEVAPGMSIGGDHFGNYQGLLPDADGRRWTECDIDYHKGVRGVKRIVFSNDGLIYYTGDHYKTFERLY